MGILPIDVACRAFLFTVAFVLAGCGGSSAISEPIRTVDVTSKVDPMAYAGEVQFRVAETFAALDRELPYALLIGLRPVSATRLGVNAFVDLRGLQQALPDLLTRELQPACSLDLDIEFEGAEAEVEGLRARALVKAGLYLCHDRGTEEERRGLRLFTQDIDVEAVLSGGLEGSCIAFRLVDLNLIPLGWIGRIATYLGVTESARVAILEEIRTILAQNPVCPELPPAIALLDPHFFAISIREVGKGGIGAVLSGSVELTAANVVAVIAIAEAGLHKPDQMDRHNDAPAGRLDIRIDGSIMFRGQKLPYGLDLGLSAVAPTRMKIETTVDLRALQRRLPKLLAGSVPVDSCGTRVTLQRVETEASGASVLARSRLAVETFDCRRTGPLKWERGATLDSQDVAIKAEMSAELIESCVVFRLLDLRRESPSAIDQSETANVRVEAARELLLTAVGVFLESTPLCPRLPPEVSALDPVLEHGAPQELGDGGVAIALDGSIDVSPQTLVNLLRLLQERGALPSPP